MDIGIIRDHKDRNNNYDDEKDLARINMFNLTKKILKPELI